MASCHSVPASIRAYSLVPEVSHASSCRRKQQCGHDWTLKMQNTFLLIVSNRTKLLFFGSWVRLPRQSPNQTLKDGKRISLAFGSLEINRYWCGTFRVYDRVKEGEFPMRSSFLIRCTLGELLFHFQHHQQQKILGFFWPLTMSPKPKRTNFQLLKMDSFRGHFSREKERGYFCLNPEIFFSGSWNGKKLLTRELKIWGIFLVKLKCSKRLPL